MDIIYEVRAATQNGQSVCCGPLHLTRSSAVGTQKMLERKWHEGTFDLLHIKRFDIVERLVVNKHFDEED